MPREDDNKRLEELYIYKCFYLTEQIFSDMFYTITRSKQHVKHDHFINDKITNDA